MRYRDIIKESMQSSGNLTWDASMASHGIYSCDFKVSDRRYYVNFMQGEEDNLTNIVWNVSFHQHGSGYEPINDPRANALKVMGNVIEAIRMFITQNNPPAIAFSGDRKNGLGKLYDLVIAKFSSEIESLGYTPYQDRGERKITTIFYKDVSLDDVIKHHDDNR